VARRKVLRRLQHLSVSAGYPSAVPVSHFRLGFHLVPTLTACFSSRFLHGADLAAEAAQITPYSPLPLCMAEARRGAKFEPAKTYGDAFCWEGRWSRKRTEQQERDETRKVVVKYEMCPGSGMHCSVWCGV
jgi:hypothetical protein